MARTTRIRFGLGLSTVWVLGAGLLGPGCSKAQEGDPGSLGGGSPESGGAGGSSGFGGSSGSGGSTPVVIVDDDGGGNGGAAGAPSVGKDDACALSSDTVEALPSVLELVVDTSGSMDWPPGWAPLTPDDSKPPGATKWEITRDALLAAVESLSGDVALGTNFFPNTSDEDDENGICLRNVVAQPITLLGRASSSARAAWTVAVNGVVPNGATPTHGAYLFGLEQLAASELPGSRFILLLTDGTPTCTLDCECTEDNLPVDSQPLIEEAARAFADGVRTFVIGSPGSEDTRDVLSQIASEGGTAKPGCSDTGPSYCHLDMTTEPDLGAGLARALDEVAVSVRSCEYAIPPPPAGQTLDPELVNVLYTSSAGTTETIGRDPSAGACNEGWQYSADGSSIVLCSDTCARVRDDGAGTVEVLFGCRTVNVEPR